MIALEEGDAPLAMANWERGCEIGGTVSCVNLAAAYIQGGTAPLACCVSACVMGRLRTAQEAAHGTGRAPSTPVGP